MDGVCDILIASVFKDNPTLYLPGAEFKAFQKAYDVWGDDGFWDDGVVRIDGKELAVTVDKIPDTAQVSVDGVAMQDCVAGVPDDMEKAIVWWRAKQTNVHFLASIPREKLEAAMSVLKALGATVTCKPQ
jgi:hypothetical protein